MKKVVIIGGGTGSFVVLTGLKKYPIDISVIVSMMDSGGSTGRLRDQYGVVPPGDLRQCLVALSEASDLWRRLFLYRFNKGDFKGHNFGNIFLTALEKNTKNYQEVIDTASYILQIKGKVIPVTFDKVHLCVEYVDGDVIETEALIDTAFHKKTPIKQAYLKPKAQCSRNVVATIREADYIIIGPGDLYTSLIPNLIVDGVAAALKKSTAKIIVIVNLMTKRGRTTDYTAFDHIKDIEKYLGKSVNIAIVNSKTVPDKILDFYKRHGEIPVVDDIGKQYKKISGDLLSNGVYNKSKADRVMRSLLRHDPDKTAKALFRIFT